MHLTEAVVLLLLAPKAAKSYCFTSSSRFRTRTALQATVRNKKSGRGSSGGRSRSSGGGAAIERESSTRWRLFNINVPLSADPGKDEPGLSPPLLGAVEKKLAQLTTSFSSQDSATLHPESLTVKRKSFDARVRRPNTEPSFAYVVDVRFAGPVTMPVATGAAEPLLDGLTHEEEKEVSSNNPPRLRGADEGDRPSVVVVGAGPAGLFAALSLANAGFRPVVVERGQPVHIRGRDIGALVNRRRLNAESNLCFGEGGAGTWSDGKLTTRIGRNSGAVRWVLASLVENGAPERILVDGKPHLGTDRMIKILKSMRESLLARGIQFRFGTRVEKLLLEGGPDGGGERRVTGVEVSEVVPEAEDPAQRTAREVLKAEHVVLAVGHSARDLYRDLVAAGVPLQPKGFAVGFRVEHPQALINDIQLKRWANLTTDERNRRGCGKVKR